MTLLLSGVLSSCHKIVDYKTLVENVYTNETEYSVELVGFLSEPENTIHTYIWEIDSKSSISFNYELPTEYAIHPHFCDSVRVIFAGEKQILYKRGEGPLVYDRMEQMAKHGIRYYYTITKQMYDSASIE